MTAAEASVAQQPRSTGWLVPVLREAAPIVILFVLFAVIAPAVLSEFRLNLLAKFLCYAILAIGIDLAWGYTGMLSLGHGAWFGIGGYALAMNMKLHAAQELGDPLPDFMTWTGLHQLPLLWVPFQNDAVAVVAALTLPGIIAFALGLLVFRSRVKGAYFSIITQALALSLTILIIGNQEVTGGFNGLTSFTSLLGRPVVKPETQHLLYLTTVVVMLLAYAGARFMVRSPLGRLMVAIRDDEDRVRFAGYNVGLLKASVFAVSAFLAGIAGALFAPQVGIISPANMDIVPSIEFVLLVAVGGRGTLIGPIIGAVVVSAARSFFSENLPDTWLYLYGALFIGVVLLFPGGIVGLVQQGIERVRGPRGLAVPAAFVPEPPPFEAEHGGPRHVR